MFLKALEMENFKSFRGEVVIPLDRGFSAITGPNGSGKSNCGDAIQFVLGPKSTRTIRAQNTKQLIFNGAEGYKPARGCTVTLVFGNPVLSNGRRRLPIENDEVRMTRLIRLTASDNVVSTYLLDVKILLRNRSIVCSTRQMPVQMVTTSCFKVTLQDLHE